ncbi:phosphatidylglycerol lysyltransferase domain-containing protein [Actinacidiphila sp. DG2A-62]|uniref:phosphatidylglycerol lysyltransferase domain-containing protein n=1 Tax=Actinacidiphila sp. DG2A-62 TaxID=3108821 RepID=UPI002DB7A605|nr:phosphatidylglycerol lysyltransferase domain-containing protein [Actinacidiphila sp. DG2A-62]MEC3994365.1 phosphatidylglycerol lysyltransferase domain-containing protein [Actinacidiphila sp. DG2A-62]
MGHWLADPYRTRVVETGRLPLLLLLLGLIGSFLFIRFSVRMIRRGVKWWPGNVQPGGLHIHHVVFGQAMMLIGGIGAFAARGGAVAFDVLAVVFGVGCGLVLDEFALVLHLEDVYWKEEGRQSVDAVILAVSVIGLMLIGQAPLGGYVGGRSYSPYLVAAVLLGFVVVCLFKGKVWTGLLGVMLPLLAVVGALRLARPASPWARWRYASRPRRMARSERREERIHNRVVRVKTRLMDAVAGAPTPVSLAKRPGPERSRPTVVEVPPSRLELLLARVLRPLRDPGAALAVWYLRAASALNAVTGLIAPFRDRVRAATDGEYVTAFLVSPGFTGAVLAFVLSVSLRRRKRAAWLVATVLTAGYLVLIAATAAVVPRAHRHPFNWVSLAVTALLLAALLVSRTAFNVRGERRNTWLALIALVAGAVVGIGLGTVLVHATDRLPPAEWGASARYASVRVLTVSGLFDLPGVDVPGWTDLAVNVLSVALMLVVLLVFFRSPRARTRLQPADERRLRALLRAYGGADSFGYFALRRDLSVSWSPDRAAAVVYRVVNGVALACGDPLGPAAARPAAVAGWLDTARRHARAPAAAYAGEAGTAAYRAAGLHAVASDEEIVLAAGALPAELAAVRRNMAAAGYRAVLRRQRDVAEEEWARLGQLADAWRQHGRRLRGVRYGPGTGRLGDAADGDCVVAECRDRRGRACALVVLVPWGADGLTVDLLRWDRESGRAPVDFLLAEVLHGAAAGRAAVAGVARVSLALAGVPGLPGLAAPRRPRRLLCERRTELPRVLAAAAFAHPAPHYRSTLR